MKIKKLAYVVLIPLFAGVIGDLCQKKTKGFRLQNLFSSVLSTAPPVALTPEDISLLKKALNQPYHFLKKGQQCFAFLSQDEKYVIKFLRWEKLEPPFWAQWIPIQVMKNLIEERSRKKEFDFTSYQLAYTELKEETGLLFLQLAPNPQLKIPIEIYDNLKIKHTIKSGEIAFILQKKIDNFEPYFRKKVAEGKVEELYPFFSKLAYLLKNRFSKHICDTDISLEHNMGILEGNPVLFDIGNLSSSKESLEIKEFMQKQAKLVFATLDNLSLPLSSFLEEEIEKITKPIQENTP